ncbi:hypothetical protein LOD99_14079 [Oopsacas minuta]|uniref:Uncharacterized protein n=1 Tax=Oopsacas minuta TaxID=111878 RepID=A0AAV7KHX7_9METZ|nr:hypothetical protein LOD99_14079 [Oopsacas minuta]
MSCSNEFIVEAKANEGCWKPASVFGHLQTEGMWLVSVYLLDNPSVEVHVPLEGIRWPRVSKVHQNIILNNKMEVEYCVKHDNYMKNGIYKWVVGEIIEFQEEKCLVKTEVEEINIATDRLVIHADILTFRDENVQIFTSYIDIVGELKNLYFNSESLKIICKDVEALTVNYRENEGKLNVLSIKPRTVHLCKTYHQKRSKIASLGKITTTSSTSVGKTDTQIEQSALSETLKIDSKLMGLAVGYNKINYQKACRVDGITSIQILNNTFIIEGTHPKAVKEAIDKLDVISVVEYFPLCNEHKIEGIRNGKIREIVLIDKGHSSKNMKVKLVGRRAEVDFAIKSLNDMKMAERIGYKPPKAKHASYEVQQDGSRLLYATKDCKPNKPHRMNSDIPYYTRNNFLIASESDSSPLTPPEKSFTKTLQDKSYENNNQAQRQPFFQQTENMSPVPCGAKPVTTEFIETDSPKSTQTRAKGLTKGRNRKIYRQRSDHSICNIEICNSKYEHGYGETWDKGKDPYPHEFRGKGKEKYHQNSKKAHSENNVQVKDKFSSIPTEDFNCLDDVFTETSQ